MSSDDSTWLHFQGWQYQDHTYWIGWLTSFLMASKLSELIMKHQITFQSRGRAACLVQFFFWYFINDIADIFGSSLTVKLFADDAKMYAIINDVNDSVLLQEGLDVHTYIRIHSKTNMTERYNQKLINVFLTWCYCSYRSWCISGQ